MKLLDNFLDKLVYYTNDYSKVYHIFLQNIPYLSYSLYIIYTYKTLDKLRQKILMFLFLSRI